MRTALAGLCFLALAAADDVTVSPRGNPSDYAAHGDAKTSVLAATIVPPDQVKKTLSAEISKQYIVVEVAIYPNSGQTFDVERLDFALKAGDRWVHTAEPRDPGDVWQGKNNPVSNHGITVTATSGVGVDREPDPVTGRPRTAAGTYEGVAVSNYPQPDPQPPPRKDPNQAAALDKARQMALPEGPVNKPVAGYLYFPQPRKKQSSYVLDYSRDDFSVDLTFPK